MSEGSAQERITAFWSQTAADYDGHPGNVPAADSAEQTAWVEAMRQALPPPPADVLDVGTGTGFAAIVAAALGHRVTAVDLSSPMLEVARRKAMAAGVTVQFVEADAVAPPFPPSSFDAVFSRHFIWTLREPATAFANWYRILRPGGRMVATHSIWEWPDEGVGGGDPENLFERHYDRSTRAALPGMTFRSMDDWVGLLEEAGFVDVRVLELTGVAQATPDEPTPFLIKARRA